MMSTDIVAKNSVPAHLAHLQQASTGADEWGDVGRTSIPRIKTDKNCIVLLQGNTELARGKPFEPLQVVLLGPGPLTRSYFKTAFQPGSNEKPSCWSIGAEVPSSKCPEPQHATCRGCPQDMKNSSGGMANSKACRYSRNIAVWVPSAPNDMVFSMRLPATSLFPKEVDSDGYMALYPLIEKMKAAKVPVESRFIMVKCDPNTAPTKPVFTIGDWLPEDLYYKAVELKGSEQASAITTPNVDDYDSAESGTQVKVQVNVTESKPKDAESSVTVNPFTGEILAESEPLFDDNDTYWKDTTTNKVAVVKAGVPIPDGLVDNVVEISKEEYEKLSQVTEAKPAVVQRRRRAPKVPESESPSVVGGSQEGLPSHVEEALNASLAGF